MAEIVNSRGYQEDRTTAKASVEEEAKRVKDRALSGAPPNSSFHTDVSKFAYNVYTLRSNRLYVALYPCASIRCCCFFVGSI